MEISEQCIKSAQNLKGSRTKSPVTYTKSPIPPEKIRKIPVFSGSVEVEQWRHSGVIIVNYEQI